MRDSAKPVTILCAEDDEDDQLLIREAFEESLVRTDLRFVHDGEDLLDYLHRRGRHDGPGKAPRPGVILLDLNMPRMDGREALREIRSTPSFHDIPIIVLTTSKAEEDVLRAHELGVNSFIAKPVTFTDMVEVMRAVGRYWSEGVESANGKGPLRAGQPAGAASDVPAAGSRAEGSAPGGKERKMETQDGATTPAEQLEQSETPPVRVLLIEDDEDDALITRELLAEAIEARFSMVWIEDPEAGLAALMQGGYDVCLLDYRLGSQTGMEVLKSAMDGDCECPIIMLTGAAERTVDLAATAAGATDYLVKGHIDGQVLERAIRYAIARHRDQIELVDYARRLEESNRDLARLNAQKNEFLGMAAHDLRNPLGVTLGFAELLASSLDELSTEDVQEMLGRIQSSSRFMRTMIDDLLDLTAIEAGTLVLRRTWVDPGTLTTDNVAVNRTLATSKGISVQLELEADLPPLWIDGRRFDQVLNNLICNAVKYSNPGSTVWVSVRRVGDEVIFAVQDKGRGIPPDLQARLFRPFSKGGSPGTGGERATGLGLAIVRRIAEAHGVRIWIESAEGKGSTFRVAVPVGGIGGEGSD